MEIVNLHNECRRTVIPPATNMVKMAWDHKAQKSAQKSANKCTKKHGPKELRAIGTSGCDENNFRAGNPVPWTKVISHWNSEKQNFKYGVGPKTPGAVIGHYKKVVWFSSSLLGCAVAYCPYEKLKYNYVCHYCPGDRLQKNMHVPYINGTQCAACPNDCDNGLCRNLNSFNSNSCPVLNNYDNCESLVEKYGCDIELTKNNCKASCEC